VRAAPRFRCPREPDNGEPTTRERDNGAASCCELFSNAAYDATAQQLSAGLHRDFELATFFVAAVPPLS
jgi:hypothetical protein